jgi:hypothetical protein
LLRYLLGTAITDTSYWDPQPAGLPEYVVRTADSLQQVGSDIGTGGAQYAPQSIEVSGMRFQTATYGNDSANSHNILMVEDAEQVSFTNITFQGPFTALLQI